MALIIRRYVNNYDRYLKKIISFFIIHEEWILYVIITIWRVKYLSYSLIVHSKFKVTTTH